MKLAPIIFLLLLAFPATAQDKKNYVHYQMQDSIIVLDRKKIAGSNILVSDRLKVIVNDSVIVQVDEMNKVIVDALVFDMRM
jgi:hypothetical protein